MPDDVTNACEPSDQSVGDQPLVTSPTLEGLESRIEKISIMPKGEPFWSEKATAIEIDDAGAGEYVKISQQGGHTDTAKFVLVDPVEWPMLRDAIEQMVDQCRSS